MAIVTACSTSASTRSSRVLDSSWYMASRATAWLCVSARLRFQHADLGLQRGHRVLALARQGAPLLGHRVAVGEPLGEFLLQAGNLHAGVDPLREDHHQGDRDHAQGRAAPGLPPARRGGEVSV
jgi:hypothetical protein